MPRSLLIRRRRGGRSENHVPRMHSATWLESDHPVRAFQRNGTTLWMARPPLLTIPHEEGTTARLQHLHSSPARAQKKPCGITSAGCAESLHPYRVRLSFVSLFRWYALKNARVPPANFRARLRRGAKSINVS